MAETTGEVIEIGDPTTGDEGSRARKKKRRFDIRDFNTIADDIISDWERRKTNRNELEKQWAEIDRQKRMEPDLKFKKMPNGKVDTEKAWMAEMELPLQAQALEVLTSDARRFMFPKGEKSFRAHAELTDDYLENIDLTSIILGDKLEVPSRIDQDNADKLVEGFLNWNMRQYDLKTHVDRINAEAFSYGMGVGRARVLKKNVWIHESKGTRPDKKKIATLQPVSIKNLYLDEPLPSMYTAQVLGKSHIAEDNIRHASLQIAAAKGSDDPDDPDGGWMPEAVRAIEPDNNGYVQVLEIEGDVIVSRKTTRDVVLPGVIVTVAVGAQNAGSTSRGVIRFRKRQYPFSSYLLFPYHYEDADCTYPSGPLMKGRPIQIAAVDALNRLMDSAALKNDPPLGWDKSSMTFGAEGGPRVHPGALWETVDEIKAYTDIGGDQAALFAIFAGLVNMYAELTGVLPARLGAQTRSHTTAFAKGAELERGAVRTVDYTDAAGDGPMERWLDMSYRIGRDLLGSNEKVSFWIEEYGGFVEITKSALPKTSTFEWFGSTGPAEVQAKRQQKIESLGLALQLDQMNVQLGGQPVVDLVSAIQQVLRAGGWSDVDTITNAQQAAQAATVPGQDIEQSPGATIAALQAIAGGAAE